MKSTKTRNGKQMIGRLKDVLKQCGVVSCVVWCGVVLEKNGEDQLDRSCEK